MVKKGNIDYGADAALIPSNDEIFGWIKDLWGIGAQGKYGYRMPGTPTDHEGAKYILQKFQEFGLENTHLESVPIPVCFPDEWSLKVLMREKVEEIPCYFLRYAACTPPEGITAEMVYVGRGTRDDFRANDIKGKIVVVSLSNELSASDERQPLYVSLGQGEPAFTYDPENTLPGDRTAGGSPMNIVGSYSLALEYGAIGYIGIIDYTVGKVNQWLHVDFAGMTLKIPALTVGPDDGDYLRSLLAAGSVEATMILTGFEGEGVTYDVYGFLIGKTDEIIAVHTHHDGWANNEASGASVVIALAKYFSQLPKESVERTLMFVGFGSHLGKRPPWDKHPCLTYRLLPKIVCDNQVEHISKEYKRVGGGFVETGLITPRNWAITGLKAGPGGSPNPYLLYFVTEAIKKYDLDRSVVVPRRIFVEPSTEVEIATKATQFAEAGIPTIRLMGGVGTWAMTYMDTPDTVMAEALRPTTAALIDIIKHEDTTPAASFLPVARIKNPLG